MYTILPFQFSRPSHHDVLLVNECGDFCFLSDTVFDNLVRHQIDETSEIFLYLKSKLFVTQGNEEIALTKLAAKYRSRKAFLREFTSLHMMVITLRCNQKCDYCQVSCAEQDAHKYDMPIQIAEKVVDMILESPSHNLKIEFQGGEPLLNWKTIRYTVTYAEQEAIKKQKKLSFVICTNLTLIDEEQLHFCRDHNISISTSLDGPQNIHDAYRKLRIGDSSYSAFIEKLDLTRKIVGHDGVDALMTTTAFSIDQLEHVVDEYIRLGMNGIFIRSLNPYGFAAEHNALLGYDMKLFTDNYLKILRYIIEKNKIVFFPEHFASLLFSRILTPFSTGFVDLQSPSGVGISGVIYDFDGAVFPADEARMLARMGDNHFCLGNVQHDSYKDIFYSKKMQNITGLSCVETTPTCAYCVFQAYCGTDPIRNYLESNHEFRNMAETAFCIKHKTIFQGLFQILQNLTDEEDAIIWSWLTHNPNLVNYHAKN